MLARLEREGIAPSPAADKETLISRVHLTLTGLPPTLEEVDAFVADESPDAYERLVDRLLASPAYAEHMAGWWMDLARWSESDGFLDDHHDRFLWPWRDWAIAAFQSNMPFDEFGTEQLAGDLLPNATKEQILATAFLRVGKRTTENGAIDAEYKAEYMIERTDNALGVAFLGLTLGCARCHDHKYDPISQHDYYSLGAFFNSNDEWGVYAPGFSGIQAGPTLPWPDGDTELKIAAAAAAIGEREAELERARRRTRRGSRDRGRARGRSRRHASPSFSALRSPRGSPHTTRLKPRARRRRPTCRTAGRRGYRPQASSSSDATRSPGRRLRKTKRRRSAGNARRSPGCSVCPATTTRKA